MLTLLLYDFYNFPQYVEYQSLSKILNEGNPFLPNNCLVLITVSADFFVHSPKFQYIVITFVRWSSMTLENWLFIVATTSLNHL